MDKRPGVCGGRELVGLHEDDSDNSKTGLSALLRKGNRRCETRSFLCLYYFTAIVCKTPGTLSCLSLCQAVRGMQGFN